MEANVTFVVVFIENLAAVRKFYNITEEVTTRLWENWIADPTPMNAIERQ